MRDDDGVAAGAGFGVALLQPVDIALAVAELERIDHRLGQLDAVERAVVEQHGEAALRVQPHVEAAGMADEEIGLELAVKQHLAAARAFVPEIVRHLLLGDDGTDLGQDEVRQPAHRDAPPAGRRAARTPAASAATSPSTASLRPGFARLVPSRFAARRCTTAVPTPAASSTRPTDAASSGGLMPN